MNRVQDQKLSYKIADKVKSKKIGKPKAGGSPLIRGVPIPP